MQNSFYALDPMPASRHLVHMSNDAPDSLIPYDEIVQEALRAVVGRVLGEVVKGGLPGEHHFYITFKTRAPGVDIPDHLIARFPDEMTIVIQNRYWDLKVDKDQISSMLHIPFAAITSFVDPAVDFALQFQVDEIEGNLNDHDPAENDGETDEVEPVDDGSNVVTVDFGKKK